MEENGQNLHRVKSQSDAMFAPSWSPNGKWIAHLRADDDDYVDVWIMRKDGSEAKNLTQSKKRGYSPISDKIRHWQYDTNWSTDGKSISFVANYAETNNIDIYAVDIQSEKISRLTNHTADDLHPYWYKY